MPPCGWRPGRVESRRTRAGRLRPRPAGPETASRSSLTSHGILPAGLLPGLLGGPDEDSLGAELGEELDGGIQVFHHDADVVHALGRHDVSMARLPSERANVPRREGCLARAARSCGRHSFRECILVSLGGIAMSIANPKILRKNYS